MHEELAARAVLLLPLDNLGVVPVAVLVGDSDLVSLGEDDQSHLPQHVLRAKVRGQTVAWRPVSTKQASVNSGQWRPCGEA